MIQILKLREFTKPDGEVIKFDKFVDESLIVDSVPFLLKNIDKIIAKIPESARWNLFYTLANCGKEKRSFVSQSVLPFDFDGIDLTKLEQYIEVVLTELGLKRHETGLICSGNGLHVLIGLENRIRTKCYFEKNRHHYKALCDKLNYALKMAKLPGKTDTAVFDARRIFRLPNTENRKAGRESRRAYIIQENIEKVDFDITTKSGVPEVAKDDQLPQSILKRYPKTDTEAIFDGCDFLKWSKAEPGKVNEPQWYAALSITARLDNGREISHEISRGHPGYTQEETDLKIDQALASSGPRMCKGIENIWDGCSKCPNYGKVKTPILLRGPNTIATEHTGFYLLTISEKGVPKKPIPQFDDLKKYFEREHPYVGLDGTNSVYVWCGTHYKIMPSAFIKEYAQAHFDPPATMAMRNEFESLIANTNLRPVEWFEDNTLRKINFQNGYYDIDSKEFLPHTPDVPFRYVLPYKFDPEAKAPTFEKMVKRITCDDESMEKVLYESMGYGISSDDVWLHKAVVLLGDGANGKSTFLDVLKALAGRDNYSSLTMTALNESEYNRQLLDKKLFNISEETPTRALLDSSLFKNLTSGGDFQMRSIYKGSYIKPNRAKLFFTCNEMPRSKDISYGFKRRLVLIPFRAKFTSEDEDFDPHIVKKLMNELPGIFNIALEGYERLVRQRGYTKCEKIDEAVNEYIAEIDTVETWLKENVLFYPANGEKGKTLSIAKLYDAYSIETKGGANSPVTKNDFAKRLPKVISDYEKRFTRGAVEDGKKIRALKNIDLAQDADLDSENVIPIDRKKC